MLTGYISSLEAYHNHSVNAAKEGKLGQSVDKWQCAISSAHKALQFFRDAEMKRQEQHIDAANITVQQAMEALNHRYGSLTCICI